MPVVVYPQIHANALLTIVSQIPLWESNPSSPLYCRRIYIGHGFQPQEQSSFRCFYPLNYRPPVRGQAGVEPASPTLNFLNFYVCCNTNYPVG